VPPAPRRPTGRPPPALPWQFLARAAFVVCGLTLLLIVDVRGAAFYFAWTLIVAALAGETLATVVYWLRSRRGEGG
jgi:hypothetical protein